MFSSNIIVREDFYENYANLGGISLYVGAIALLVYIAWEFKKWI